MDFLSAIGVSIASMVIVFLILILLAWMIDAFKLLARGSERGAAKKPAPASRPAAASPASVSATARHPGQPFASADQGQGDAMVAMLVAACVAKETIQKDVRIISCERVR